MNTDERTIRAPVAQGVRLIALGLLDDAHQAGETLTTDSDADALHDFRVATRRLRSWVRAFRDELDDAVSKADRRALRDIAHATNLGRDLDVHLAWTRKARKGLRRKRRESANWLIAHLEERQRTAGDAVDAALIKRFESLRGRLIDRLSNVSVPVIAETEGPTLAAGIGSRLVDHADEVGAALTKVRTVENETEAHEARIAAKRLRYLLEPGAGFVKKGDDVLARLKSLQDDLGTLHDAHVIGHVIAHAASEPQAPAEGLLALVERARSDADDAFKRVEKEWLHGRFRSFARDLATIARRLAALHD